MPEFENQQSDASRIVSEIARLFIALGLDWRDETQLRLLAREALAHANNPQLDHGIEANAQSRLKLNVFGLIALMLKTMEEGAELGEHIHGNDLWKALARALWAEKNGPGNAS